MCARAALLCALVLAAAQAYTIDCNREYTDCDTELSKLTGEEDEVSATSEVVTPAETLTDPPLTTTEEPLTGPPPTRSRLPETTESATEEETVINSNQKAQGRLLNLNIDELKNFALTLHNDTDISKKITDLSDVNLDGDDEFDPAKMIVPKNPKAHKELADTFFANLQAPFHRAMEAHLSDDGKEDVTCAENQIIYKVGDHVDRGCEETCICTPDGTFNCSPRCKHPYIRRGRTLNDPLCFETPVDNCCSIVACATGHGDANMTRIEVCKYGNDTHLVGSTWTVGCEQRCTCEKNSVVTCKPRCPPLPQSDKCINVQDPKDACCEVQVCDVSQDVHEDQTDNVTNSTATSEKQNLTEEPATSKTMRPLVLTEPIGSIKVLQNNSVQVTLMHTNSSEDPIHLLLSEDGGATFRDVQLNYDNLILNLNGGKNYILKTKETGTRFNFTITSMNVERANAPEELVEVNKKIGCHQDGKFYEVGEEFHIGCSELCECTGDEARECAALECPSHVGLELMSKGCVRWAPSPPPSPPNCCPRAARCLSDGTCHYKGVPIPNWTDVPISLSGCSMRCFCENGELDCQEVCSPLPPLPPQTLRCPPAHRPAPVNISIDDCCKQWGCVPNAGSEDNIKTDTTSATVPVSFPSRQNLPTDNDPYRRLNLKHYITSGPDDSSQSNENLTVFNFEHLHVPLDSEESVEFANISNFDNNGGYPETQDGYPVFPLKPIPIKQPVYKIIHSSFANVNSPLLANHAHAKAQKQPTNPKETIPKHHQPVYFTPAKKIVSEVPKNYVPPIVYNGHSLPLFKTDRNITVITPERFTLPIPSILARTPTDEKPHRPYMTALERFPKPKPVFDINHWDQNVKQHVLTKLPNPYEHVLLRAVPRPHVNEPTYLAKATKAYSALDLENILTQMEVESEANRNLERSADRNRLIDGHTPSDEPPSSTQTHIPKAPFLPTVPPDPSVHFPDDDDDGQNHIIQRPGSGLRPVILPGITVPPGNENKKLTVITLMSDSPTSVKMLFGLPPVLVGLRGSVDLRYTDKADEEITHWHSQVFAPADEILTTSRLEFRLTGLKPSTVYKIRGKLYLHNLPVEPESEIYSIRTLDLPTAAPVEVKRRVVDSRLAVQELNDSVAHITWKRFTEEDLQFIDAIQVRYRPVGNPIYSMTELLHHSRDSVLLLELRPGSRYEASLVLVPPPRATTELHDPTVLEFTTAPYVDPYNWSVQLEARSVGSEAAELTWRGIPLPAERWVRVYRAAHACSAGRREHDAFRLATRDQAPTITISGLQADTRCRVWLELFLTNGKVKTSNVLEIKTKSLDTPENIDNVIEASSVGGAMAPRGDYYGALVVVGVVAALGALTSLLLLLVVVRRHRPRSVPITPVPTAPRESSLPPYDNPAYKLELQQETMDL